MKQSRPVPDADGSILIHTLLLSLLASAILGATMSFCQVQLRDVRIHRSSVVALQAAKAELENARLLISLADYDAQGNTILRDAVSRQDSRIPGTLVEVNEIGATGTGWYELTARVPYEGDYERVVSMPVREYDSFSSYLFFCDDSMGFAAKTVEGAIHSNQHIDFYFAGGVYGPSVTAVSGFNYYYGATTSNTSLLGAVDPAASPIEFSSVTSGPLADLDYLETEADASYSFDATAETRVFLENSTGTQVVRVQRLSGGTVTSDTVLSTPANGILYFEGDVSVEGAVVDSLTVASRGSITITSDIVYQDADGDPAQLNGKDVSQPYIPNPDYDNRAALGLVAHNNVVISNSVPDNFEVNGSLMALTGTVAIDAWLSGDYGSFLKDSYRLFGGLVSADRSALVLTSGGSIISGFQSGSSQYDGALVSRPPPSFPRIDEPRFFAGRVDK